MSRSVLGSLWKSQWAFRPGETQRENSGLSKLFHRTLAWANSLFLELDAVFCELFSNLRNGDRQAAKTTRGEIKLVLSTRNPLLVLGAFFFFHFCSHTFATSNAETSLCFHSNNVLFGESNGESLADISNYIWLVEVKTFIPINFNWQYLHGSVTRHNG